MPYLCQYNVWSLIYADASLLIQTPAHLAVLLPLFNADVITFILFMGFSVHSHDSLFHTFFS